ncbi:MAG: hypothetical protein NTY47_05145 [Candidatus Omnitrophica bacterium]|nr:hypothetical protein [Candidatus Omnitrophota bacterium]
MGNKRSLGIMIFGILETIIGALGTYVFVICTVTAVSGFLSPSNVYAGEAVGFGMIGMLLSLSCPIFLLAGIGVLRLKPWGRKASLIATIVTILMILVPSYLYALWCALHHEYSTYMIIIFAAVGSILIFPILWFFNLSHIKERFK